MAKNIGGIWKRKTHDGQDMLSISIEIDGTKRSFVAFTNSYKQEGDNKPDYSIMPPREQKEDEKPPFCS